MKKLLLFFVLLFMAAFGGIATGKGNSPPVNMQLTLTSASQDQMVGLTQESAQPIELRAEVSPRCRDVQFSYSSQFNLVSNYQPVSNTEFSAAVMNSSTNKSEGMLELRAEVLPRCRTVSAESFFHYTARDVIGFAEAISPACRDVITVS